MSNWWRVADGVRKSRFLRSYCTCTIQAIPREITGHRISVRDRAHGRVPSVVFSQNYVHKNPSDDDSTSTVTKTSSVSRKLLLTTEHKQLSSILKRIEEPFFCSTTFPIQIRAGPGSSTVIEQGKVLPIKLHRNGDGKILNLVLAWAEDGTQMVVDVPVVYKGEDTCPGLKKGGNLSKMRASLRYLCLAEHIPQKIEVDVSNLDIGDTISVDQIEVHGGSTLLSKNGKVPVCKIAVTNEENNPSVV